MSPRATTARPRSVAVSRWPGSAHRATMATVSLVERALISREGDGERSSPMQHVWSGDGRAARRLPHLRDTVRPLGHDRPRDDRRHGGRRARPPRRARDPGTPGSGEPGNPDGELATTSVGAESAEARPARSRPKTPLRPYVPPASAEGVHAPAEEMTDVSDPFAAGLASRAASLPHRSPTSGAAAAGPGAERAPNAVAAPVAGPEPPSPPQAGAVGPSPTGGAGAGGGPIEAPAWAASPPPHGSPFAGIAPPGSDRPPPSGPPAVGIPGPPPTEAVPAPASPTPASAGAARHQRAPRPLRADHEPAAHGMGHHTAADGRADGARGHTGGHTDPTSSATPDRDRRRAGAPRRRPPLAARPRRRPRRRHQRPASTATSAAPRSSRPRSAPRTTARTPPTCGAAPRTEGLGADHSWVVGGTSDSSVGSFVAHATRSLTHDVATSSPGSPAVRPRRSRHARRCRSGS